MRGNGCILMGSHLGSFEVLRTLGMFKKSLPINVLMHEANANKLNSIFHALNPEIKPHIIAMGRPDTLLKVHECIERKEIVGMLGDRTFTSEKRVVCDFLDGKITLPQGPLAVAAILEVPIILFFGLYRGGKLYELHFELFEAKSGRRSAADARPASISGRNAMRTGSNIIVGWRRITGSIFIVTGMNKAACLRRPVTAAAIVMLVAMAATAPRTFGAESWDLPQLMVELAQVQSRDSRFTEKKTLALFKAPAESSGVLSYRRPDHVEKHVLLPKDESISVEGDQLTWRDGVSGKQRSLRLQDNVVVAALVNSIRATLAGDLPALQRYFEVKLEGSAARWVLSLTPTDSTLRRSVQAMRIEGSDNQVASIDVMESGGDRSVMVIKND